MPQYDLLDLTTVARSWGRGVIFRAPRWDPTVGALTLTHVGDTEGDIVVNTNPETATLTLPELTGPAGHDMDYLGENPVIEVPMYVTDPAMHALISPSGSAHAGRERRGVVVEHTIVIFPENLWVDPATSRVDRTKVFEAVVASGGHAWEFDGNALSAEKLTLLDSAFWLWRAVFSRPPRRFRGGAGNDRKNIETVTIQGLHHPDMPDGHHLYTTGDPADSGIDLFGSS